MGVGVEGAPSQACVAAQNLGLNVATCWPRSCSGFVVYVLGWAEVLDAKWLPRLNRIALIGNIVFATLIFVSSIVAAALTGESVAPWWRWLACVRG